MISDVLDRTEPLLPDHEIAVEVAEALPPTPLDFVQISQVLTNLLDNAGRHSPSGAAISISAEVVRAQLRLTVFNQGSHIPDSDPDHLFDKFYRLSVAPGGVGLGLSIARGIVERTRPHPPAALEPCLGTTIRERSQLAAGDYVLTQETGYAPDQDRAGVGYRASGMTWRTKCQMLN